MTKVWLFIRCKLLAWHKLQSISHVSDGYGVDYVTMGCRVCRWVWTRKRF